MNTEQLVELARSGAPFNADWAGSKVYTRAGALQTNAELLADALNALAAVAAERDAAVVREQMLAARVRELEAQNADVRKILHASAGDGLREVAAMVHSECHEVAGQRDALKAQLAALKAQAREVVRANEILDGTEVIDELWADRCEAADAALSKLAAMVKEGEE